MVKVYYSYEFDKVVGVVAATQCNFAVDRKRKLIVSGSSQYVVLTGLKTGEVVRYLHKEGKNVPVRHIKLSKRSIFAAYEDGEIAVWSLGSYDFESSFDLHRSTVSSIALSDDEIVMVSGGMDGQIIIWDLLSQQQQVIKNAHHSAITQVLYLSILHQGKPLNLILSTGKDGFLKVWNAANRLCLGVISTQTTEALAMDYSPQRGLVYVGTNKEDVVLVRVNEDEKEEVCEVVGVFKRKNYTRCQQLEVSGDRMVVLSEKRMEVYELLSDQKLKQKKKRVKSRIKSKGEEEPQEQVVEPQINEYQLHILPLQQKTLLSRVHSFCTSLPHTYLTNGTDILLLDSQLPLTSSSQRTLQLQMQHPFLIQRNPNSINVHNYGQFNRLYSIGVKAQCCSLFNSGFLMVVEKESVSVWDLGRNERICELKEEWSGCWIRKSKCLLWRDNQLGIFEVGTTKKGKTLIRQTSNKLFEDKITSAMYRHSYDKYAVNLQNSQIHLNYSDSNKNHLKLYGHKLPVNSFDISTDDALLVSGSTDKDIRFWDLEFGYSVKTLFAHSQPVTAVAFVPDTHYVVSGGKDGHVKFWDGDTHQLILDLEENLLEVKSLVVSGAGDYIVAGGMDGGFRVWRQGQDQTVAGDQDEKNTEKVMIEEYARDKFKDRETKTRYEDLKHGQEIIEALENHEQPSFLVKLLKKIAAGNLKSTLSFLHASHVAKLQQYLRFMIAQRYEVELCWRVLEVLDRGSDLGKELREYWAGLGRQLRVNRESLKIMLKTVEEEKELGL